MTSTPDEGQEPSEALDQRQAEDTLNDRGVDDVLDEGYTTAERWSPGEGFGSTADEAKQGESLDQRLTQEEPDADPYAEEDDDFLDDGEVGTTRAGRLVDPNEGSGEDVDSELYGDDVGIDGAAASAEEAAVHVVDDWVDED